MAFPLYNVLGFYYQCSCRCVKGIIFYDGLVIKSINCTVFTDFQKLSIFQILSLEFILKIFLKFDLKFLLFLS